MPRINRIPKMPVWFARYIDSLPDYKVDELMLWYTQSLGRTIFSSTERMPLVYDAGQEMYDKLRSLAGLSERRIARQARNIQLSAKYKYADNSRQERKRQ